jgi:aspartate-semialdehyde dehydrogenase
MSVSIGRLTQISEKQIRFVALVHNTIRGAAGCALLNAEAYDLLMG